MLTNNQGALNRAQSLLQSGRYRSARAVLRVALRIRPDEGELWLLKAIAHHAEGQFFEALHDAETALSLIPFQSSGWLVLADCYAHTAKKELALGVYQHLLANGPHPTDFYAGLYAGFRRCGRNDLALCACKKAFEVDPNNHEAMFGMAHCMAQLGHESEAIARVLETAVQLAPDKPVYRVSLAVQLVRIEQAEDAYEQLAAISHADLERVACCCTARLLCALCLRADDQQRAKVLCKVLDRGARHGRSGDGS